MLRVKAELRPVLSDLLTHGSPGLDVGRTMGRRFIAVNTVAGLGAAAFIAGLVCNGQATDASHRLQIQTAGELYMAVCPNVFIAS